MRYALCVVVLAVLFWRGAGTPYLADNERLAVSMASAYSVNPDSVDYVLPNYPFTVAFTESVREELAHTWDSLTVNPRVHEWGKCLSFNIMVPKKGASGTPFYLITKAQDPDSSFDTTPMSVRFYCPAGMVYLHAHVPTTCLSLVGIYGMEVFEETCVPGGIMAYLCQPSEQDKANLNRRRRQSEVGMPFGMVQCDSRSNVPYFTDQ